MHSTRAEEKASESLWGEACALVALRSCFNVIPYSTFVSSHLCLGSVQFDSKQTTLLTVTVHPVTVHLYTALF